MKCKYIRLFAAVLASLLLLPGCAEQQNNDSEKNNQEENKATATKTVTCLTSYTSTNGETELKYVFTYEEDGVHMKPDPCVSGYENVYDWDGTLLYEKRYDEAGVNTYRLDHTYDENGNRTELLQTDLRDNTVASRNSYTYDDDGRLIWESYEGRNGYVSYTITYTYDDRGFLAQALECSGDGEEMEKSVFTCDDSGKILTCDQYLISEERGTPGQWCTFTCTYDGEGRLLSNVWEQVREDSRVSDSQYYTYDDQGRLSGFRRVNFNGNTDSELVYTYDADGRLTNITDSATGWENTVHYTELTLDEELAQKAEAWVLDGAMKVLVKTPEFED